MEDLNKVKNYWDTYSKSVPSQYKDHWINSDGTAINEKLYFEIANYITGFFPDNAQTLRVLEIGCGTGRILKKISEISKQPINCIGIDFSSSQIEVAKLENSGDNITYYNLDVLEYESKIKNQPSEKFDLIYLHSVTQYFPSEDYYKSFFDSCVNLLSNHGVLIFIDVPISWFLEEMRSRPNITFLSLAKDAVKKIIKYKPKVINVMT